MYTNKNFSGWGVETYRKLFLSVMLKSRDRVKKLNIFIFWYKHYFDPYPPYEEIIS